MKKILFIFLLLIISINLFAERVLIPESEVNRVGFDKINSQADKFIRKSKLGYYIFEIDIQKLKEIGVEHYKIEEKKIKISQLPNDTYINSQWSVSKTNLQNLWDSNTDCSNIIIAVVDTGVEYTHEDLSSNIFLNQDEVCDDGIDNDNNGYIDDCFGWDFAYDDKNPLDGNGHGTHVTGIIAAQGNNSKGIAGVCWNAKIMPIKVLDDSGDGNESDVATGIEYAVDNGAKIINLSVEANFSLPLVYSAISYAEENGVMVITAAGNYGYDIDQNYIYPAVYSKDFDNLINVGNSDQNDLLGTRSNYGSIMVDIFAPGEYIYSTWKGNSYKYETGTSMAAPFFTGVLANFLSYNNSTSFTPILLKALAIKSVDEIYTFYGLTISGGRVNADKILSAGFTPTIVKVFPESFSTNKFRPVLNEKLEIYGLLNNTQNVYINDAPVDFEQWDNTTIYITVPFTDTYFKLHTKDLDGRLSNKVKITPILYKVKANDAYYTFTSSAKITGLSGNLLSGYTIYGEGINFNLNSNYDSITLTVTKSSALAGGCYVEDDSGNVFQMSKLDTTKCQISNLATNKNYTFYEGEEIVGSSGGGGCSFSGNIKPTSFDGSFFLIFVLIMLRLFKRNTILINETD
jgi:subtilisin family serine protease